LISDAARDHVDEHLWITPHEARSTMRATRSPSPINAVYFRDLAQATPGTPAGPGQRAENRGVHEHRARGWVGTQPTRVLALRQGLTAGLAAESRLSTHGEQTVVGNLPRTIDAAGK